MTPPADIVMLRLPAVGDAINVKPPDAAEIDLIAATIELATTILGTDALDIASGAPAVASPAKWREADRTLSTTAAWPADWSTVVAHARDRLSISLDTKERLVL